MTIKEYYQAGKKILTDEIFSNYLPFMNHDDEFTLNGLLKYNFGEKTLIYSDETEINEVVKIVLLKYNKEYESIWNSWLFKLPLEYTEIAEKLEKITGNKTLNNKIIAELTENITKTNDLTDTLTLNTTTNNNGSVNSENITNQTTTYDTTTETTGTGKTTQSGTTTQTQSNKPFDSTDFIDTSKTLTTPGEIVDSATDTTTTNTGTDKIDSTNNTDTSTTDTTTNTGTETTTSTGTVKDDKESTDTTTTTGSEENTENLDGSNKITVIRELLENIEKYKALYVNSIYDRITQNLLEMLTIRTWEIGYFDW